MAMILSAFVPSLVHMLSQMAQDEVGQLLGVPGEVKKLTRMVHQIEGVLVDAERRQNESEAINRWVMQLKDVMYDADDVIDLCRIKTDERRVQSGSSSTSKTSCGIHFLACFRNPVFAYQIASKIKELNSRMNAIVRQIGLLGLIENSGASSEDRQIASIISRRTHPVVAPSDLVGEKIEEDTEQLVELLIKDVTQGQGNIPIVAIEGMGGIGKTTLAKKVYNDPRIQEDFKPLIIWVCVSKQVNPVELLKNVIRVVIGRDYGGIEEISELVPRLEGYIRGKKCLLILDDIWAESEEVWDKYLRVPMLSGAPESRVLITTRDDGVAMRMGAIHTLKVKRLSDEDGWSLLVKQVANGVESEIQELKDIGMQIVQKCDGLPLAIKTTSGVLRMKRKSTSEWQAVLTSNIWSMHGLPGDLHRAFYLSYEDLSSPLKQCFIFCSLFHGDYRFTRSNLIYLWLAEGFLQDKEDFWKLGNEYYTELLLRNFLEGTEIYYEEEQSKMHDILWSFACQLAKDENYVLREGQVLSRPEGSRTVRRLTIQEYKVNPNVIKKEKRLRTLLLYSGYAIPLDGLCEAFLNLRILDLSCCSFFYSLPYFLCDLVHLRYLHVGCSNIKDLPDSIGMLKSLLYLNVGNCKFLYHVPPSIMKLQELKFLSIINSNIEGIPSGLKKLDKLIELHGFRLDKNNSKYFSSLDELESLSQLISLSLEGLDRVFDRNIARRANLRSKNQLRDLNLRYTSLRPEQQLSQTNEEKMTTKNVLNELSPPSSLEILRIEGYFGSHLPDWLNFWKALPNLRYIEINNCACFEVLSPLGQLPNLDYLRIIDVYSVKSVGEEFMQGDIQSKEPTVHAMNYSAIPAFPKLNELCFQRMPNWEEWQWHEGQPAMPNLKKLFIRGCPQLRSLPNGLSLHATSLEYLEIDIADKLITIKNLPSIKEIHISRSPNLKTLKNLKSLQRMTLIDYEMEILPDYMKTTMPQKLRIQCSEELLVDIITDGESGSEWHKFKHIPKVKICTKDESLYAAYQKTPFSFTTNKAPSQFRDDVTTRVES